MKKRIFSLFLIFALALSAALPVFSAGETFVFDQSGYISDEGEGELNDIAEEIFDRYNIGAYYLINEDLVNESTIKWAEDFYAENNLCADCILFAVDKEKYYFYFSGRAEDIFYEEDEDDFWEIYSDEDTYRSGVREYLKAVSAKLEQYLGDSPQNAEASMSADGFIPIAPITDPTDTDNPDKDTSENPGSTPIDIFAEYTRVNDAAGLLTQEQRTALCAKLDEISQRQQLDIVVTTVNTLGDKTATEYADDFFDYNGYGFGENYDGILLLISMEDRDWAISTTGYGITAFTDEGQRYITDNFLSYISDGKYYKGFDKFADLCDKFITEAKSGKPYDVGHMPWTLLSSTGTLIALGIGICLAFIVLAIMKAGLNSVSKQVTANSYVTGNGLHIDNSKDTYLYSNVIKTKKPEPSRSSSGFSGGSSTHSGSSGRSHGGSSGKF